MLSKVMCYALTGIEGYAVDVETDISAGLTGMEIVGLAGTAVKESKERIRSAIKNSGMIYPAKRITVNLAPADTKKDGPTFDLALAVGILAASEQIVTKKYKEFVFLGELSLDGKLRGVCGVMPLLISAVQQGYTRFIVPKDNAKEAAFIEGTEVFAFEKLSEVVGFLNGVENYLPVLHTSYDSSLKTDGYDVDMSDIKGQASILDACPFICRHHSGGLKVFGLWQRQETASQHEEHPQENGRNAWREALHHQRAWRRIPYAGGG